MSIVLFYCILSFMITFTYSIINVIFSFLYSSLIPFFLSSFLFHARPGHLSSVEWLRRQCMVRLQGRSVAHLYVFHGSFMLDVLAAFPLVVFPFVGVSNNAILAVLAMRILQLLRVFKIINMLFYIQMISVSGASGWRMIMGNVVVTFYTIMVMVNFCACLWYFVGTIGEEGAEGWLAQEYSAAPITMHLPLSVAAVLRFRLRAHVCGRMHAC
jgi:hypothetical protein